MSDVKGQIRARWVELLSFYGIPSNTLLAAEPESAAIDPSSPDAEARTLIKVKLAAKKQPDQRVYVEHWLSSQKDALESADNTATASIARDVNAASKRAEAAGFPVRPTITEPRSGLSESAETLDNVLRPLDIGELLVDLLQQRAKDQADAAAGKSKFSRWLLPVLGVAMVVGLATIARRLPLPLPPMPR